MLGRSNSSCKSRPLPKRDGPDPEKQGGVALLWDEPGIGQAVAPLDQTSGSAWKSLGQRAQNLLQARGQLKSTHRQAMRLLGVREGRAFREQRSKGGAAFLPTTLLQSGGARKLNYDLSQYSVGELWGRIEVYGFERFGWNHDEHRCELRHEPGYRGVLWSSGSQTLPTSCRARRIFLQLQNVCLAVLVWVLVYTQEPGFQMLRGRGAARTAVQQFALKGAKKAAVIYWCCTNTFFTGVGQGALQHLAANGFEVVKAYEVQDNMTVLEEAIDWVIAERVDVVLTGLTTGVFQLFLESLEANRNQSLAQAS
eukprot:s4029_g3.t1